MAKTGTHGLFYAIDDGHARAGAEEHDFARSLVAVESDGSPWFESRVEYAVVPVEEDAGVHGALAALEIRVGRGLLLVVVYQHDSIGF